MAGGQEKIKCGDHKKGSLIKERAGSGLICSYPDCQSNLRWRYSNDFPDFQCCTGLSLKHFKEAQRRRGEVCLSACRTAFTR